MMLTCWASMLTPARGAYVRPRALRLARGNLPVVRSFHEPHIDVRKADVRGVMTARGN